MIKVTQVDGMAKLALPCEFSDSDEQFSIKSLTGAIKDRIFDSTNLKPSPLKNRPQTNKKINLIVSKGKSILDLHNNNDYPAITQDHRFLGVT